MTTVARPLAGRSRAPSSLCQGCGVRLTIGDPRSMEIWPTRLALDVDTVTFLLMAAAEYARLSKKADEPESAVSFIDWVDGVLRQSHTHPDHDGTTSRSEEGGFGRHYAHRHPDPIPFTPLPRTWER